MRKKNQRTNLAEGEIVLRIPVSYETLDTQGHLGWKMNSSDIRFSSPVGDEKTKKFVLDALKEKGIL